MLITAPEEETLPEYSEKRVFLAGTIDNGDSEDWQATIAGLITRPNVKIFNPRRSGWNSDASSMDVSQQIIWEQKYMNKATDVFFNILPKSTSMITLLELGQMCERKRVASRDQQKQCVVCCPREYMRFDNVFTMCAINGIPLITEFDLAVQYLNIRLNLKF